MGVYHNLLNKKFDLNNYVKKIGKFLFNYCFMVHILILLIKLLI